MLERERRDLQPKRDLEVMAGDECVQLCERAPQLGLDARIEVTRSARRVEDPLRGEVVEQRGPVREPDAMRAQATNDAVAPTRDLTAQLDELRGEVRVFRDMPRRPPLAGIGIVVDEPRAFARELRELAHLCKLAKLFVDPTFPASQSRGGAVVHGRQYQAMRAVTMPPGATATAVGTRATPYLRASSGRRDTSTVKTSRPEATSSRSSVWQSVHSGCVN